MRGRAKLQDFFVNAKVPRAQRDRVPLVLSGDDIIWVVGYRISESFKVTEKTGRSIRLEASRLT
jgi:tRNA(Ile)-lysidine synthase